MANHELKDLAASLARGVLGSLLLGGAIYQGFAAHPVEEHEQASVGPREVATATVERRAGVETNVLWGAVTADDRAVLGFTVSGRIRRVSVAVGETVRRGETLVSLDASAFRHGLQGAEADLTRRRAELDQLVRERQRVEALSRVGIATSEEAERVDTGAIQAQAGIQAAAAQREEMGRLVAESSLRAPFSGVVVAVHARQGEVASPGAPMVEIVAEDGPLEIEADVPDVYASSIDIDQAVTVYSRDERAYEAEIVAIANAATTGSRRLLRTRFSLLEAQHGLRAGQTVRIHIRNITEPRLYAPLAAVLDPAGSSPHVYVVSDGVAERRRVELGELEGEDVVVLGGLDEGEQVVVGGRALLLPRQQVTVVSEPGDSVVAHGEARTHEESAR